MILRNIRNALIDIIFNIIGEALFMKSLRYIRNIMNFVVMLKEAISILLGARSWTNPAKAPQ